jgi:hypothetical protein
MKQISTFENFIGRDTSNTLAKGINENIIKRQILSDDIGYDIETTVENISGETYVFLTQISDDGRETVVLSVEHAKQLMNILKTVR